MWFNVMLTPGTLQQFDEGTARERSFVAITDVEGVAHAFPFFHFPALNICTHYSHSKLTML
jgi:hypothetical protein